LPRKLAFGASINCGKIVYKCAFRDDNAQPNRYLDLNVNPNLVDFYSPT